MKHILLSVCFGTFILLAESCKKNSHEDIEFTYEKASGLWVLYEITLTDGSIINKELSLQKVFGAYSESVQLNENRTFIPVAWFDRNNFQLSTLEQGTYEYFPISKTLKFAGTFHDDYLVKKFQEGELWLNTSNGNLVKFKKQQ